MAKRKKNLHALCQWIKDKRKRNEKDFSFYHNKIPFNHINNNNKKI